jgi:hypothetical protein
MNDGKGNMIPAEDSWDGIVPNPSYVVGARCYAISMDNGSAFDVHENLSIYHANIDALYILRSRVALYMQDWQTAIDYAQKAINHNGTLYNLIGTEGSGYPMNLSNPEVVYSNGSSMLGNMLQIHPQKASGWSNNTPIWIVSDELYHLFSDKDARKVTYITTKDDVDETKPTYHISTCSFPYF